MAALSDNSRQKNSKNLLPHTGEGVVIDLGTGDGQFVYRSAQKNPAKFYIGLDANVAPLKKISMKATRKPAKGGLPNVLFLQAAIEDLPDELNGIADEIHIHFPWGSLLGTLLRGDTITLESLRRICADECLVEIVFGVDPIRDESELRRLGLDLPTLDYLNTNLIPKYKAAGFSVLDKGILPQSDWAKLETSWARKLKSNDKREVFYLILQAA